MYEEMLVNDAPVSTQFITLITIGNVIINNIQGLHYYNSKLLLSFYDYVVIFA